MKEPDSRAAPPSTATSRRRFCALAAAAGASAVLPAYAEAPDWLPSLGRRPAHAEFLEVGGATIEVDLDPANATADASSLLQWVKHAAMAVAVYYGRFPVRRYRVLIKVIPGADGVFGGSTRGGRNSEASTEVHVGPHNTDAALAADWTLTRQMIRTGFPGHSQAWIAEGLAAYVEPLARAEAGFLTPEAAWAGLARNMPRGNPGIGDRGLDHAATLDRARWGGAQFFLLADVTMRGETRNRAGLQDAMRAIVNSGGTIDAHWPAAMAFETGDYATGTRVLTTEYHAMRSSPVRVDLATVWRELGVERNTLGGVRLNDAAPLADVRRTLTSAS